MNELFDYPAVKSLVLLITIMAGVYFVAFEIGIFFFRDKELRTFWLKVWFIGTGLIGVVLWLILTFWENEHFK